MTKFTGSERRDLDVGEAEDGRRNAPMDMAMQMATAVTAMGAGTAGVTIYGPMKGNDNRHRI